MTEAQARSAVSVSALVVGGVYLYRRVTEGPGGTPPPVASPAAAGQLLGVGPVANAGRFVTGWGVVYVVLALLAESQPDITGTFAALVATGALLGNGLALSTDVNARLAAKPQPKAQGLPPTVDLSKLSGFPNPIPTASIPRLTMTPPAGPRTPVPQPPAGGFAGSPGNVRGGQ